MTLLSDARSMQASVLKRDQEEPGTSRTARTRNVRHNREEDGDLDGEGRGCEVQGQDIDKDTYKAEGAGHRGINKDEGAGHQGMYKGGGGGTPGGPPTYIRPGTRRPTSTSTRTTGTSVNRYKRPVLKDKGGRGRRR